MTRLLQPTVGSTAFAACARLLRRAPAWVLAAALTVVPGAGCGRGEAPPADPAAPGVLPLEFEPAGRVRFDGLDEASGMQTGTGGTLYLHDDEDKRLFLADSAGRRLRALEVGETNNRDWEDITRIPGSNGPLLVIGDIGDNHNSRRNVSLYFVPEPGDDGGAVATHRVRITYPDGPRDAESLAYDAAGGRLLILSKRDQPPRLYGVPLDLALWQQDLEAEFLGEVPGFRPPTRTDILRNPGRGLWVSQPTGMDISPDGRLAAVITYRSLYLFERAEDEDWAAALGRPPREIVGPPGTQDEAVTFSEDGRSVFVTAEGYPAPLWRLEWPDTPLNP